MTKVCVLFIQMHVNKSPTIQQVPYKSRPGVGEPVKPCPTNTPHLMLFDDRREQRAQLCRLPTGELKTRVWLASSMGQGEENLGALEECRACSSHPHTTHCQLPNRTATNTDLCAASVKQPSVQVSQQRSPMYRLQPKHVEGKSAYVGQEVCVCVHYTQR